MRIDELQGELSTLADEIEPFEGDMQSLHHRERRRRVVVRSLAAALAVVVAVSMVVVVRHRDDGRVRVTGAGPKEVPLAQLTHTDVIVVPATPAVQKELEASPLVGRYALLPRGFRFVLSGAGDATSALCALESQNGYAVQAAGPGSDIAQVLRAKVGGQATVFDVSYYFGVDMEVFLRVGASDAQVAAVRARLESDPDIAFVRFVSRADAYAIFKKDFADQPRLIQGTKPSDLPVSFRVDLAPGASLPSTAARYNSVDGVDTVVTHEGSQLVPRVRPAQVRTACSKP